MQMRKFSIFVKENLKTNTRMIKNTVKLEIIVIMQGSIEVLWMVYVT